MAAIDVATSRSASGNTMLADLPPSSNVSGVSDSAAAAITSRAVAQPPVNDTLSTPGWRTSASPAAAPPTTTFSTPGANPPSSASSANRSAPNGATPGGFTTTVLPAASAGTALWPTPIIGPVPGTIAPLTPYGPAPPP